MMSHDVLFLHLGAGYMGVLTKLHMDRTRWDTFPFGLGLTDPQPQGGTARVADGDVSESEGRLSSGGGSTVTPFLFPIWTG